MNIELADLTINISLTDIAGIRACWEWLLKDMGRVLLISKLGDLFLEGKDGSIYWLATDNGDLTPIAKSVSEFEQLLKDNEAVDNWFLPELIDTLQKSGLTLNKNEIYSYKKLPILGGDYHVDNIEATDISVHFALTGQIHQQIKNLPDGNRIEIKLTD